MSSKKPADNDNDDAQPISGHKGRDRWMRAVAAAPDLSALALRLAIRLCVSFNCKTGRCDPGYRTLADDMAVSKRSVFRAIAELDAGGWIAVDRTRGANTRNNQITLLMPSDQVTTVVTRSGDSMVSPENETPQVTENGPSGDRKPGFQVTHSVAAHKPEQPEENLKERGSAARTSRVDRESAPTNSATADDETLSQRAGGPALIDTGAAKQPSPPASKDTGAPPNGADGLPAVDDAKRQVRFDLAKTAYPPDRIGDEAEAWRVFHETKLDERPAVEVRAAIYEFRSERGDDVPPLSEALTIIGMATTN